MDCITKDIFQNSIQFQLDPTYLTKALDTNTVLIFDEVIPQSDEILNEDLTNTITTQLESVPNISLSNPELNNETNSLTKPSNIIYKCIKCNEDFEKVNLYRKHLKVHENTKRFKCDKCDVSFNIEINLKLHTVTHNEGELKCPVCNITFNRFASFKSHSILHQVDEYCCRECGAEFDKIEDLDKHSRTHSNYNKENKELICPHCKVRFQENKAFKEHISFHFQVRKMMIYDRKSKRTIGSSKGGSHVCVNCRKSFTKLALLERHMRIHSGEKPFVCEYCNKGFAQKGTLTIHLSKHKGLKPFQCTLCSARFIQKGNLRTHVEKTHMAPVPGVQMYKCNICTCVFKKLASLNIHMSKSHSTKKEVGDITDIMQQLKELEQQTTVVTPEMKAVDRQIVEQNKKVLQEIKEGSLKPNINYIKLLDGGVNQRKYLIKQTKVNGIKFYLCNYCTKGFKKPSDLIRHTRTHTKEKPFLCKLCNSSFSLKSTLFYHLETHKRKKTYICEICEKEFTSIRSLNTHINQDHPEKNSKFKCTICFKWFNSSYKAKLHKEMHLNEKNLSHVVLKQPLLKTTHGLLTMLPPKLKAPNIDPNNTLRQFRCEVCNLKFVKLYHLKRHLLSHDEEKKFKCQQCSKSYVTSYGLREHQITHFGDEKFICKICNKKYVSASLLKRHEMTHNSDKPYMCPYCDKTFKTVLMCRKHILIHKKDVQPSFTVNNNNKEKKDKNKTGDINLNNQIGVVQPNTNQLIDESIVTKLELPEIVNNNNEAGSIEQIFQPEEIFVQGDNSQEFTNSIHIINENNLNENLISDQNEIQILINYEDLQLLNNNSNLYNNLFSQLKQQQASNSFIIGNLPDLQENNILNFGTLSDPNTNEIYNNTNEIFSSNNNTDNNINDCVTLPSIAEITNNTLTNFNNNNELAAMDNNNKKTPNVLIDENDLLCDDNIQFYSNINQELDLISTNEQQLEETNDPLIILPSDFTNLTTDSMLVFDSNNDLTDDNSANIYKNTNVICSKCNKLVNLADNSIKAHNCIESTTDLVDVSDLVTDLLPETTIHTNKLITIEQEEIDIETPGSRNEVNQVNTNNNLMLICEQCNRVFNNKDMFERHTYNHKFFNTVECEYCCKGFKKLSDRTRHVRIHTGEKPYQCDKCERKFALKSTLDSHSRTHNPSSYKEFTCNVCNSFFSSKSSLKVHMHVHTGNKPFDCSYCPQKFRTLSHKRSHEHNQHLKQTDDKKCQNKEMKVTNLLASVAMEAVNDKGSDNNLPNSDQLSEQIVQIHCSNDDNILNETDNFSESIQIDSLLLQQLSTSNLLLDDQLITSTAIQLEDGTILNIKTQDNSDVNFLSSFESVSDTTIINNNNNNNIKTNNNNVKNNEKPRNLECSICHKTYASKDVLRKHKKIHGINKPFQCTKCDRGFDLQEDLDKHDQITHLGHMPFPCPFCKNSFAKNSNLKIHLKRIHHIMND